MNPPAKNPEYYKNIFHEVIGQYQELSTICGTSSCNTVYNSYFGVHDFPTICEFMADIEHVSRDTLGKKDWELFNKLFIIEKMNSRPLLTEPNNRLNLLADKLGRAFIKNQLYPINLYVKKRVN